MPLVPRIDNPPTIPRRGVHGFLGQCHAVFDAYTDLETQFIVVSKCLTLQVLLHHLPWYLVDRGFPLRHERKPVTGDGANTVTGVKMHTGNITFT